MAWAFIREGRSVRQFKKDFPDAAIQDFDADNTRTAPGWFNDDCSRVYVGEYWVVDHSPRRRLLLKPAAATMANPQPQPEARWLDEIGGEKALKGLEGLILADRTVEYPYVCQYLTNGVELLAKTGQQQRTPWRGLSIPIVACFGKVLYMDDGKGVERKMLSLIRLARDPAMLYCYYRTNQAELVGMTPKTPFIGYIGQFRGREKQWKSVNKRPVAYLEASATTETTGTQVLPLPQRQPYDPPIQSLELGAESARRAIQAAIGQSPLPTSAQRRNEKSGVALKEIDRSSQKGSYHFVDHYEAAITRVGALLDELIPHYYDTARDVTTRKPDGTPEVVRINDPGAKDYIDATAGRHDVTISVGPAYQSEREQASDFADTFVSNPQIAGVIGPQKMAKVLSLAVKLKNVGPIGDELADIIDPGEEGQAPDPAAMAAQMQQMQQQMQQMQQIIETEQIKNDTIIKKAQIDAEAEIEKQKIKSAADIQIAQRSSVDKNAQTHADVVKAGAKIEAEAIENDKDRAHERGMAAQSHVGALEQGEQGAAHARQQAADKAASDKGAK